MIAQFTGDRNQRYNSTALNIVFQARWMRRAGTLPKIISVFTFEPVSVQQFR